MTPSTSLKKMEKIILKIKFDLILKKPVQYILICHFLPFMLSYVSFGRPAEMLSVAKAVRAGNVRRDLAAVEEEDSGRDGLDEFARMRGEEQRPGGADFG